jgi:hypothetical protein
MESSCIVRMLKEKMKKRWVTRVGKGKRASLVLKRLAEDEQIYTNVCLVEMWRAYDETPVKCCINRVVVLRNVIWS